MLMINPGDKFNCELMKEFNENRIRCSALGYHDDEMRFLYGTLIVWFNYNADAINAHLDMIWRNWFGSKKWHDVDI